MQSPLAAQFRTELNAIYAALLALPRELAETPWREGGWTRKQIVCHPRWHLAQLSAAGVTAG